VNDNYNPTPPPMPPGPWPIIPERADLGSIFWWTFGIIWAITTLVSSLVGPGLLTAGVGGMVAAAIVGGLVVLAVWAWRRWRDAKHPAVRS
jgi:hypothetical protein